MRRASIRSSTPMARSIRAYYRHLTKQTARNYTDAEGKHPFVKANGEIDMAAYYRHLTKQKARNYTDAEGKHPFVKANGELDMPAYYRHRDERAARNYTDANGKHTSKPMARSIYWSTAGMKRAKGEELYG